MYLGYYFKSVYWCQIVIRSYVIYCCPLYMNEMIAPIVYKTVNQRSNEVKSYMCLQAGDSSCS